ncbi:transient receptor potential cation channel subfamily V member 2-like [Suricata suricatta]|uniref:transient receptor potential cation channel subfamily V member 2-like n=1 Tax=Suricata suricatta TaxID=37032 RepID=UPI001155F132|nr:transient receptor potential cation channel subfamily V member 2-like [Suricata suricatta]
MKAVLNLRDGANACILPLLQIDRDSGNPQPLVNAQCTDEYYRGHSALHIAIEKRSLQCVKLLVENGANVHARACGQFFQKKSQGTCFYFGELPLSLAACTKQWDVVTYLLENPHQPASLQAADSLGNTALHALVMIADDSAENSALVIRMYDGLLRAGARLCPTVQLEDIPNLQGLTPLKLAAKEGKIEIFRHILQREFSGPCQPLSRKFTEWCYGPVRVSLYDLASVDSCEDNSVLEIIAFHCRSPVSPLGAGGGGLARPLLKNFLPSLEIVIHRSICHLSLSLDASEMTQTSVLLVDIGEKKQRASQSHSGGSVPDTQGVKSRSEDATKPPERESTVGSGLLIIIENWFGFEA